MALPQAAPLSEVLSQARQRWTQTKRVAQAVSSQSAAGNTPSRNVLGLLDNLRRDHAYFTEVAATPGLGAFAQAQYGDGGYDIVADFNAFLAALQGAIDWIVAAFPKDAGGYLLAQTLDADGARVDREFTPAQTAGLRGALAALIATVE